MKRTSLGTATRAQALRRAYRLMRAHFGHQHWWPGETPFEVCVGAILTQNTSWSNVERAIANLKAARVLEPGKLFALSESQLAALIRPAGYFNVKARRLRSFLRVLVEDFGGDLKRLYGETQAVNCAKRAKTLPDFQNFNRGHESVSPSCSSANLFLGFPALNGCH